MSPLDISDIFLKKRANEGDDLAKDYLTSNLVEKLSLDIESLGMSMQMQLSIQAHGSSLHKLNTKEVDRELKTIVNQGLDKLIQSYMKDTDLFKTRLQIMQLENLKELSDAGLLTYDQIKNLNLSIDYKQIAGKIRDLAYIDVIRILKVLIITSIFRRAERRQFFA